jgi:hypothetical protein
LVTWTTELNSLSNLVVSVYGTQLDIIEKGWQDRKRLMIDFNGD